MTRRTPFLAALLALTGACALPAQAHAKPFLCGAPEVLMSDIYGAAQPGYSYWMMYLQKNCEG